MKRDYQLNPQQLLVALELQNLQPHILAWTKKSNTIFTRVFSRMFAPPSYPNGYYLYGDVGRGKTSVIDDYLKNQTIPYLREHYYAFMQGVHQRLSALSGIENPIAAMVKQLAVKYQLIFLDEFLVLDIADAMVLRQLLSELASRRVFVITTSNIAPESLYRDGFQRKSFLPAIEFIKTKYQVSELTGEIDYRSTNVETTKYWSSSMLEPSVDGWFYLVTGESAREEIIHVQQRSFKIRGKSKNYLMVDLEVLCGDRRSSVDYLLLAQKYQVLILRNVPQQCSDDLVRRLIVLVDVWSDCNKIVLLVGAIELLLQSSSLSEEGKRMLSRLTQMQTMYHATTHRAMDSFF
ncbi:MAG: cell division protein ZapE [Methylacidiphilales bacterium]|nr:cell division protein ZapE [Candidatus Methylacidiphilales bacterium]